MLKRFAYYYKNHWQLFLVDIMSAFIMSGLDLVFPLFIKEMVDYHFPNRNFVLVTKLIFILLGLYLLRYILQYIVHYWGHVVGIRIETDMRRDLFKHLQKLSFKFYDNNKTGYLMSRIVNDLHNLSELAHHGPEDVLISTVTLVGSFVILANINWQLAVLTFLIVPIMVYFSIKLGKKMHRAFKLIKEDLGQVNSQIEDSLSGVRVVKSFTNQDFEQQKFDQENENYRQSRETAMKTMGQFYSTMNFLSNMIILVTLGIGGYFIYQQQLTTGELIAFIFYIKLFIKPIEKLMQFNEQFQKGMAGFQRFTKLLDIESDIKEYDEAKKLTTVKGKIEYNDVSFSYEEDNRVLSEVNLQINAGQTIAFVGPSGVGKSTLCKLLPRFYELDKGQILIDGQNIKDLTIESLRKQIGIVQQDVFLFNGTVRDNIAYGNLKASKEEIIAAAKKANAHQFIMNLENGYETQIGERGVKLSGGQKQRISIARSFLKNPPILILDEATSSLDNESEQIIQESIERLAQDRTTLVIAHRLSTVRDADKIIVLAADGIVESGKHNELLNKPNGVYSNLYQKQFDEELTA
ncbi:ABC-type multidrug transport system, ATPase and permease component [Halobacteroides halobius DSM 5150]|uniref:ABC-type multidrug transport system, ATPase and permease component n=1 Tax=Halobacteroides halobius (strain ATCC 35273 / DSM 5150 / MD-1) TaxID=748449 RepID=L0K996_HALHC|nr:ABC transporter ATP-binding protein [Halobacteroides halobius]AGB41591.1 ABC-type multidrug transport system, ATPase and permease component [Halobacteroides halobius DSM 5150]